MNYGKAIIAIRELAGLRQVQLARMVGISKTSLSLIEAGKTKPSDETLKKIATVFNTDVVFIGLLAIGLGHKNTLTNAKFRQLFPDFENKVLSIIEKDRKQRVVQKNPRGTRPKM